MQTKLAKQWFFNRCHRACYDAAADAAAAEEARKAEEAKAAAEAASKKFSQDDVNRFLAEEKRKAQKANTDLANQLKSLKETANLTAQEKADLELRIQALQAEGQTKEQLLKQENDRLKTKLEEDSKKLAAERDSWKQRFSEAEITRAITDAAVANNAFSAGQVVTLLKGQTHLVEELDEAGKPKGTYVPKVSYVDVDKEGKEIKLELTVSEAVKRMLDTPQKFGNLFKTTANGGVGGSTMPGGGSGNEPPIDDPAKYREYRKNHPLK